jgi:hypothetical protein
MINLRRKKKPNMNFSRFYTVCYLSSEPEDAKRSSQILKLYIYQSSHLYVVQHLLFEQMFVERLF